MTGRFVYVNDRLVPREDARVSVFDRGLLYGDSIFETIRVAQGVPLFVDAHLERLVRSAASLELTLPNAPEDLARMIRETVDANACGDAMCRLMITRGVGPLGLSTRGVGAPTLVIIAEPVTFPAERYAHGLRVIVSRHRKLPAEEGDVVAKTGNYLAGILAKREAESQGADDALHENPEGEIVEATTANVFALIDGALFTPPLSAGLLPGLTRRRIFDLAAQEDMGVTERPLRVDDLERASEIFLTSTIAGVVPVTRLGDAPVGDGRPGPVATRLHALERLHALHANGIGNNAP